MMRLYLFSTHDTVSDTVNDAVKNIVNDPESEAARFSRDGYLVCRNSLPAELVNTLRTTAEAALAPPLAPVEYEAEVGYPGSPQSLHAAGGKTPRRLLQAYSRDAAFRDAARHPAITERLQRFIGSERIALSQNHHNCVMTKHPGFSSRTAWHRDMRYWSFDRPELVSVWIPLVPEHQANGVLQLLPGSHRIDLDRGRLDARLFLREDLEPNQALIKAAQSEALNPGDVLFFHCQTFHAATANHTQAVKLSLVYTFHAQDNRPISDTRSDRDASIGVT